MMEPRLQRQLGALESMLRRARLWRRMAWWWAAAALLGFLIFVVQGFTGWDSPLVWILPLALGAAAAAMLWAGHRRQSSDTREVVTLLEREHPDLRRLLATASEQEPDPASGEFHFLQLRVVDEVLRHPQKISWERRLKSEWITARNWHALAFSLLLVVLLLKPITISWQPALHFSPWRGLLSKETVVTPGDVEVERGTGLVVSIRFGTRPPPEATLVMVTTAGETKRIPMVRHLADPVFGVSLMDISESALYHVDYDGQKTRDYKISVFEYPALARADASLEFPEYTGLTNKTIRDTRRISAVEGTKLTYDLELNKPVMRARLLGKEQTLNLAVQSNAFAILPAMPLAESDRYLLELVDADGRTNKLRSEFVFQVLPDRPAALKVLFPRGDPRVSALEELQLDFEASDDFGLLKYGIGYGPAGEEPQFLELGQAVPRNEKQRFSHMIALERLGAEADQVISYFVWADDYGPDGQVRRSFSDVFFAEVRPFEEIYRQDQSGGESGSQSQGGGQGGNESTRLAELQKQIAIATWKLQMQKGTALAPATP